MLFSDWKNLKGYGGRSIISAAKSDERPPFAVVEYEIPVPENLKLSDKKLLFFSDLHWGNTEMDLTPLAELAKNVSPDWIVFGGDLANYACFFDEAFDALAKTFSALTKPAKIAVPGNWDRRRRRWFPNSIWNAKFAELGFHYLINETRLIDGILFHGMDDSRNGHPKLRREEFSSDNLNCVLAHNPGSVVDAFRGGQKSQSDSAVKTNCDCLALCGHTHGGQVRIPGFGALLTSTKYWKAFEYGLYENTRINTKMIVSSGLGVTRIPLRLFCDPEVVIVKFQNSLK